VRASLALQRHMVDASIGAATCPAAHWPAADPRVRTILQHGRRQCIVARYNGTSGMRYVVYWVTPKTAHTKIAKLLRRPPFYPSGLAADHVNSINAGSMFDVGRECNHRAGGGNCSLPPLLSNILSQRPFEFTFWRDPVGHLISAAGQAAYCLNTHWCIRRELPWPLNTAADVSTLLLSTMFDDMPAIIVPDRNQTRLYSSPASAAKTVHDAIRTAGRRNMREMQTCHSYGRCTNSMPRSRVKSKVIFNRCTSNDRRKGNETLRRCMRHLYPQSAGYGWHSAGLARLHFVGRMEHFIEDWRRLLLRLGESRTQADRFGTSLWERRVINRRSALNPVLAPGGSEYARLAHDTSDSPVGAHRHAERCWNASLSVYGR